MDVSRNDDSDNIRSPTLVNGRMYTLAELLRGKRWKNQRSVLQNYPETNETTVNTYILVHMGVQFKRRGRHQWN